MVKNRDKAPQIEDVAHVCREKFLLCFLLEGSSSAFGLHRDEILCHPVNEWFPWIHNRCMNPQGGGQCLEVDTDVLLGPELHNYGFSLYGPVVYMYIVFH